MPRQKPASRVSRADIERIYRVFDDRKTLIEHLQHTCSIQFERIAQMQAQLDRLERQVKKLTAAASMPGRRR